jgi:hypothetical protein
VPDFTPEQLRALADKMEAEKAAPPAPAAPADPPAQSGEVVAFVDVRLLAGLRALIEIGGGGAKEIPEGVLREVRQSLAHEEHIVHLREKDPTGKLAAAYLAFHVEQQAKKQGAASDKSTMVAQLKAQLAELEGK